MIDKHILIPCKPRSLTLIIFLGFSRKIRVFVMEADVNATEQNPAQYVEGKINIDPRECLFCHLDKIFPVTGMTKKEIKKHDHKAHIIRLPPEYKVIYAFAELFSSMNHSVRDIRDVYSTKNVNTFLTEYLPNTSMQHELSGVQLVRIEKAFRKVVSVYTANGMLTEQERRDFFAQMLDARSIKASYQTSRQLIENVKIDEMWLDPKATISKKVYAVAINDRYGKGDEEVHISTFVHEVAENIRINIAMIVKEHERHGIGHLDDMIETCAGLARYSEVVAKYMIQNKVSLKRFDTIFWGYMFTPEHIHAILYNSFFLFPHDTARLVCDLAYSHLTRSCYRCDFKCLREEK